MRTIRKIKTEKNLLQIIGKLKQRKKKIVAMCGSFDLLHAGHVASLEEARRKGDVLVVLLNTDDSVRRYKGPTRPIISGLHRARMLAALEAVDYVVFFNELTPKRVLKEISPHIYCKGFDWGKNCIERSVVEERGGQVIVLSERLDISSTNVIQAVLAAHKSRAAKQALFLGVVMRKAEKQGIVRFSRTQGFHVYMLSDSGAAIRKGEIQRVLSWAKEKKINISKSWFIGEDVQTILLGREVNAKTVKIGKDMPRSLKIGAHYRARTAKEAMRLIKK